MYRQTLVIGLVVATLAGCNMLNTRDDSQAATTPPASVALAAPAPVTPAPAAAPAADTMAQQAYKPAMKSTAALNPVTVRAVGYGTESNYNGYTRGQQQLLGIRASKLDAYRNLAEQVYGIHINGHTTVSAMMIKNDSYRGYVEAIIQGARVVSVNPVGDGNYETTVELSLSRDFFNCLNTGNCSGQNTANHVVQDNYYAGEAM